MFSLSFFCRKLWVKDITEEQIDCSTLHHVLLMFLQHSCASRTGDSGILAPLKEFAFSKTLIIGAFCTSIITNCVFPLCFLYINYSLCFLKLLQWFLSSISPFFPIWISHRCCRGHKWYLSNHCNNMGWSCVTSCSLKSSFWRCEIRLIV